MAIFDWRDFESVTGNATLRALAQRYESAVGAERVEQWQAFVNELLELLPQAETDSGRVGVDAAVDRFRERSAGAPGPTKKTIFVSHQRYDADWAERAAWEASDWGLDYWLDIHDLGFSTTGAPSVPASIHAALIAVIIEMALLNCTHVVSMQTKNARGSRWVPYELGRAKERVRIATNAASWFEDPIWLDPGGDYLALTFCAQRDLDLYAWLHKVAARKSPLHPNRIWRGKPGMPTHQLPN
jgi:hypothetical protein